MKTGSQRREELLNEAKACVCRDRNNHYGDAEDNFQDIASLWNIAFGMKKEVLFTSLDVAIAFALVKIARMSTSPELLDHWVDLAGYAACGGGIVKLKQEEGIERASAAIIQEEYYDHGTQAHKSLAPRPAQGAGQ